MISNNLSDFSQVETLNTPDSTEQLLECKRCPQSGCKILLSQYPKINKKDLDNCPESWQQLFGPNPNPCFCPVIQWSVSHNSVWPYFLGPIRQLLSQVYRTQNKYEGSSCSWERKNRQ